MKTTREGDHQKDHWGKLLPVAFTVTGNEPNRKASCHIKFSNNTQLNNIELEHSRMIQTLKQLTEIWRYSVSWLCTSLKRRIAWFDQAKFDVSSWVISMFDCSSEPLVILPNEPLFDSPQILELESLVNPTECRLSYPVLALLGTQTTYVKHHIFTIW